MKRVIFYHTTIIWNILTYPYIKIKCDWICSTLHHMAGQTGQPARSYWGFKIWPVRFDGQIRVDAVRSVGSILIDSSTGWPFRYRMTSPSFLFLYCSSSLLRCNCNSTSLNILRSEIHWFKESSPQRRLEIRTGCSCLTFSVSWRYTSIFSPYITSLLSSSLLKLQFNSVSTFLHILRSENHWFKELCLEELTDLDSSIFVSFSNWPTNLWRSWRPTVGFAWKVVDLEFCFYLSMEEEGSVCLRWNWWFPWKGGRWARIG